MTSFGGRRFAAVLALTLGAAVPAAPSVSASSAASARTSEAVAVWQQRSSGGDWEIGFSVLGRPSPSSSPRELSWQAPGMIEAIAGDDENPHVAMPRGAAGAVAVWQHGAGSSTDVMWSRFDGTAWSPAQTIAFDGGDYDPAIAIDEAGAALAVWINERDGVRRLVGARFDGSAWSEPAVVGGSAASLPEVAFTIDGAALAAFVDLAGGKHRVHTARFDGAAWTAPSAVPLTAAQVSALSEHGAGSYGAPGGTFQRIGLAPDGEGGAHLAWSGPVGKDLVDRYGGRTIMASRLDGSGTWAPVTLENGSVSISGGCYGADVVATGHGDPLFVHGSTASVVEYTRAIDDRVTFAGRAYASGYDDVRPSAAALSDSVVSVSSGLAYPWDEGVPGAIVWSVGTLRPTEGDYVAHVTWDTPAVLPLDADARYPEVASALGGSTVPQRVTAAGRAAAVVAGGESALDTGPQSGDGVTETTLPTGTGVRSERNGDLVRTTVTAAETTIPTEPPIVVRGLRVWAEAGCAFGSRGSTRIASIRVGSDPPVEVDARQNTEIPLGAMTIRVNSIERGPNRTIVRGVRVLGPGIDLVAGYAEASIGGCAGSGLPVPSGPGHAH